MTFSEMLPKLLGGDRIRRGSWDIRSDSHYRYYDGLLAYHYSFVNSRDERCWTASHMESYESAFSVDDLLATDWELVE